MPRPALYGLIIQGALVAASCSSHAELWRRTADMKRRVRDDDDRLEALLGDLERERRRLTAQAPPPPGTPSLYGDLPGTRKYTSLESHAGAMNHLWVLVCGFLVFFMQAGFALLEAGCCRVANVQSILLKNITDACVGTLGWWVFGWSFAYSGPTNSAGYKENYFAGSQQFAGHTFIDERPDHQLEPTGAVVKWFFRWAFCATATTIVSGGVTERVNFPGYVIFSFLMTSFVYPIVVAWTWGNGWLADMNTPGYMDFAGGGVVHLTGGIAALAGTAIAGPRQGRFEGMTARERMVKLPDSFMPHSQPLIALGTLILWFGWYGFNCGSTLAMDSNEVAFLAAQVAMNTTISAACGGLVFALLRLALSRKYDLSGLCAGILGGLVSITAGCANVECGSACLIGTLGGVICLSASSLVKAARVDDPVDAFAVHGACGAWGVFSAAAFDWGRGLTHVHAWKGFRCYGWQSTSPGCPHDGTDKQGGNLFAANMAEICAIVLWSGGLAAVIFACLRASGCLVRPDRINAPPIDNFTYKGYDDAPEDLWLDQRKSL